MYAQSSGISSSDLYLTPPECLIFNGKTDAEGKVYLRYYRKELKLGSNFEMRIQSYSIDTRTMYNVIQDQYLVEYVNKSGTSSSKFVTPSKVVTVLDALHAIQAIDFDIVFNFSIPYAVTIALKGGKLKLPVALARCVGLCDGAGSPRELTKALNPKYRITTDNVNILVEDGSSSGVLVLPINYSDNVWNWVSPHSFQSLYFYSDLVVTEIVAGARVPLLGVYPFREADVVNVMQDNSPLWRRVDKNIVRDCYLQFADSRGRTFEGVEISVECKLRRRNLK